MSRIPFVTDSKVLLYTKPRLKAQPVLENSIQIFMVSATTPIKSS